MGNRPAHMQNIQKYLIKKRLPGTACLTVSFPVCLPRRLKGWQGGPPQIKNGSPRRKPVDSRSFAGSISRISPAKTRCPFAFIVATQAASKSCPITIFNPAFASPISRPIAPENNDITSLFSLYFLYSVMLPTSFFLHLISAGKNEMPFKGTPQNLCDIL